MFKVREKDLSHKIWFQVSAFATHYSYNNENYLNFYPELDRLSSRVLYWDCHFEIGKYMTATGLEPAST